MKRILIVGFMSCAAMAIAACDMQPTSQRMAVKENWPNGRGTMSYYEICVRGVVYYAYSHSWAPAFGPDSKVITCPKKE